MKIKLMAVTLVKKFGPSYIKENRIRKISKAFFGIQYPHLASPPNINYPNLKIYPLYNNPFKTLNNMWVLGECIDSDKATICFKVKDYKKYVIK